MLSGMTDKPKLAVFDVDGTIAECGVINPRALEGIRHLQNSGCITTLSTGRGYVRLRNLLGDMFEEIISPDAILVLEHGTKLVDRQGNILFAEFLSPEEVEHVIDFLRANISLFKFAWFNPTDVNRKIFFWCADPRDEDEQIAERAEYAEVFTSSIGKLREMLLSEQLTNISFRLKDFITVENLKLVFTRTETNIIFQDGNMEFMRSNINKGLAVLEAAKKLGIKKYDILLAGNAINDVEMLDLDVPTAVLVGTESTRKTILGYMSDTSIVTQVDTPTDLGDFLCTI